MKPHLTIKPWVLGFAALCAAAGSDALTLGRARGGALLGQPLELVVSVQMALDESVPGECFEAEVYYGDNRQDAGRVRVRVPDVAVGQILAVRVSSSLPVDEPIVTVYLRGGCGQKTTRKYLLLADMVSEPAAALDAATVAAPRAVATSTSEPKPAVAVVQAPPPAPNSDKSSAAKKSRTLAVNPPATSLRSADRLTRSGSTEPFAKRPRLKLAAIDLSEHDPVLRLSNELLSTPLDDLQKRAEAVALWRSLNTTAQDVRNEQARIQTLDKDVKALREQTTKNQAALADLVGRLEKAESQRYANPVVYGLLVLLLVFLAGLAWAWRQLREANLDPYPWWSGIGEGMQTEIPPDASGRVAASSMPQTEALESKAPRTVAQVTQPAARRGFKALDIDLEMGPSVFAPLLRDTGSPSQVKPSVPLSRGAALDTGARDFAHSVAGTLRAINSDEVLDVRQQADFFMTLGRYEDAIALLEGNVRDSGESNPLVYLDLLQILHTLSRKEQFDLYRKEFNDLFTGVVPEYKLFHQPSKRLEDYPAVSRAICIAWSSGVALEVIEGYLVREEGRDKRGDFDLEAFRDLLLLHAVAGRVDGISESRLAPFSAMRPAVSHGVLDLALDSISAGMGNDTIPLPATGTAAQTVDLDLTSDHNLIDFELSGFSSVGQVTTGKR